MTKLQAKLTVLIALTSLALCALPAGAQEKPIPKVTLNLENTDIQVVLKQISEATGITILAESTVMGKTNVNIEDQPLEAAVASICKPFHWEWQKLYLFLDPQEPATTLGDKLAHTLRALSQLPVQGLVYPQSKGDSVLYSYRVPQKSKSEQGLNLPQDYQMVYLITNPHRPSLEHMVDNEARQRFLDQWHQMSLQQQINDVRESIALRAHLLNSLSPEARVQLGRAGAQTFATLPPEHQRQLVWTSMQMASGLDPTLLRKWMREFFQTQ